MATSTLQASYAWDATAGVSDARRFVRDMGAAYLDAAEAETGQLRRYPYRQAAEAVAQQFATALQKADQDRRYAVNFAGGLATYLCTMFEGHCISDPAGYDPLEDLLENEARDFVAEYEQQEAANV